MQNKMCYSCFLSFSMSWNIGLSRKVILKFHNKLGFFQNVLQENSGKISLMVIESQNLPNLQNLAKTHKYLV